MSAIEKYTDKLIHDAYEQGKHDFAARVTDAIEGERWSVKAMTNRDIFLIELINMRNEELAKIKCKTLDCLECPLVGEFNCSKKMIDWLKKEHDGNDD